MGGNEDDRLRREIMIRQQLANDTMLLIRNKKDYSSFTKYSKALKANKLHISHNNDKFGLRQVGNHGEDEVLQTDLNTLKESQSQDNIGYKNRLNLKFPVIEKLQKEKRIMNLKV